MRKLAISGAFLALLPLYATTLRELSLNTMIQKSTAIVRGKTEKISSGLRGSIIYTYYQVQVSQQWKGVKASEITFAVPGGTLKGQRQTYSGAPSLTDGQEYVLFLWTSPSGLTQIIGLSQGLFVLVPMAGGDSMMIRPASAETVLDQNGNAAANSPYSIRLSDFQSLAASLIGSQGAR